tara:strand:- start:741 stop:1454 length:714 start_codon:yes stop_codon:yes gene_type:complete
MKKTYITKKQDLLMYSLTTFFCDKHNIKELLSILKDNNGKISLRIIDWFVTNYSKKFNITYPLSITRPNGSIINKQFMVYIDYKSQLKAFSKKQFDPFCRRDRIVFYYTKEDSIITTVGQLNFFRWAIQNKILEYIRNHLQVIEEDMNTSIKHIYCKNVITTKIKKISRHKVKGKSKRKTIHSISKIKPFRSKKKDGSIVSKKKQTIEKNRKKRTELSAAATKKLNKHKTSVVVKFE